MRWEEDEMRGMGEKKWGEGDCVCMTSEWNILCVRKEWVNEIGQTTRIRWRRRETCWLVCWWCFVNFSNLLILRDYFFFVSFLTLLRFLIHFASLFLIPTIGILHPVDSRCKESCKIEIKLKKVRREEEIELYYLLM